MADILENPVDLIDDAYEQEIQVEQEMIEVVAYRSYNRLDDKPQINGVELVGNKTSSDLGITAQIESAVNSETQARAQADNTLQGKIDTEKLARQQADSTLQGNIDAEETARKAADKDIQDVLDGETLARQNADTALGGRIDTEIHDRQVADIALQGQIDAITSKSDVVDVVANYVALQAYDTSSLGNNDVIKVLDDETHEDALTYYRWSTTTQTWTYIGQESPYYSKSQTDTLLLGKQNTIDSSHKLSADLVDDTSTTNKFVTASDITNWNAKQDALTAGTGIDITGGVISTPAIVPEVVTELPTTGAEGKLYLTPKAHTTSTATGNPIEATITAQAGQLESFQLDGDTFQQSYTGKNLFPSSVTWTANRAFPTSNQGEWANWAGYYGFLDYIEVEPDTTYTFSNAEHLKFIYGLQYYDSDKNWISGTNDAQTFTTPSNCHYIRGAVSSNTAPTQCQLELGSTATPYEPYVGGQPSPSPEYPQQIQTVTGEQTVSINGTNYPISLGTIELCKLGTYQDYIWKDGDDWKVHKATGKTTLTDSTDFTRQSYGTNTYTTNSQFNDMRRAASEAPMLASSFGTVSWNNRATATNAVIYQNLATPNVIYLEIRNTSFTTLQELTTYLGNSPISVYYELATANDTTITNTTLIAQLEAIRTASLENGTNTITNTATGSNLAGDMEIGYYGFNPTNRYDKFIWLDLNNDYEQIGS